MPTIARGPNLDPDWDWAPGPENGDVRLYTRTDGDFNIPLPYYSAQFSDISDITEEKVKRSKGWRLYYRNFGTSESPVRNPIFVLYNKYTATFRVFIYSAAHHEDFSNAFVKVTRTNIGNSATKPALFTFKSGELLQHYNQDANTVAAIKFTNDGWYYFDFNTIGYQPNIDKSKFSDAALQFAVSGVNKQTLNISGGFTADAIYSKGSNNLFSNSSNFLSNLNGKAVGEFFKNFSQNELLKDKANEAEEEGKSSIADRLLGLLDSPFSELIPGLSGVTGFIGTLFGGNSAPALTGFNGKLTLSGDANTIKRDLDTHSVRISNAQVTNGERVGESLYEDDIGIFNLQGSGIIVTDAERGGGRCVTPRYGEREICSDFYTLEIAPDTKIKINPTLKNESGLVITKKLSDFESPSDYSSVDKFKRNFSTYFTCVRVQSRYFSTCPDTVGINVKIKIEKPSENNFKPKFFIQTYKVPVNY